MTFKIRASASAGSPKMVIFIYIYMFDNFYCLHIFIARLLISISSIFGTFQKSLLEHT